MPGTSGQQAFECKDAEDENNEEGQLTERRESSKLNKRTSSILHDTVNQWHNRIDSLLQAEPTGIQQ